MVFVLSVRFLAQLRNTEMIKSLYCRHGRAAGGCEDPQRRQSWAVAFTGLGYGWRLGE